MTVKANPRYDLMARAPGALIPVRKKSLAAPKEKDWRYYGKKLTILFNRWIRYRDTTDDGGGFRSGICITCRKPFSFEKLQACHYIPSQYLGTRWHEKNVNAGCAHCNKWLEGNRTEYTKWLPVRWGKHILDELEVVKKLNGKHPDIFSLQLKIEDYKNRLKAFN